MKNVVEFIGFVLIMLGGCMLNSDGTAFTIAVLMCIVGMGLIALMERLFV